MLVIFSSKPSADLTMFGDVAIQLLHLMGHSGEVPSALNSEDVPAALALLEKAIEESKRQPSPEVDEEDEDDTVPVSIANRAVPLIDMLKAAVRAESYVMWAGKS